MPFETPASAEKKEPNASQICYDLLMKSANDWEKRGVTGDELIEKKIEFLEMKSDMIRQESPGSNLVTADYKDVRLTPELQKAMVEWFKGAANNLRKGLEEERERKAKDIK